MSEIVAAVPAHQQSGFRLWRGRLSRRLWRIVRAMLITNLFILLTALLAAVCFHAYATRGAEQQEQLISWSTRYILTPGILVDERHLPPSAVLPLARVIEKLFIGSAGLGPAREGHDYWRGRLLQAMASTYGKVGDTAAQIDRGEEAARVFAGLVAKHPRHIEYRRRLARSHQMLADDEAAAGRYERALAGFSAALEVSRGLVADEPEHWRWRWYVALAHLGAGRSLSTSGHADAARRSLDAAEVAAAALRADQPSDSRWPELIADIARARSASAPQQ